MYTIILTHSSARGLCNRSSTLQISIMTVSLMLLGVLFGCFAAAETQANGNCRVWGRDYFHGQIFTLPGISRCLRFRCYQGHWKLYEEGCDFTGACYPVGATTAVVNCRTYTCTKLIRNYTVTYQPVITRTRCIDYYGECHDSGSTGFSREKNGTVYRICACMVFSNGRVVYYCY